MADPVDPISLRLRAKRRALGWSLRNLAERCGIGSAAFVLSIENGRKHPTEPVARRLARALGESEELLASWSQAFSSRDLATLLTAARQLTEDREIASFMAGTWSPPVPPSPAKDDIGVPRLRIPRLAPGADPGDGLEPACPVLEVLRLGARELGNPETLVRPFACSIPPEWSVRVPALRAGQVAIVSRDRAAIARQHVFLVRSAAGVLPAHVSWNRREILLHPSPGADDFIVVPAANERELSERIVGRVARILEIEIGDRNR